MIAIKIIMLDTPHISQTNLCHLSIYISLSSPCMQNRTGALCADCSSGYAPSFNDATFICVECHGSYYNWLIWLLVMYIPLTVLFIIAVLFMSM